MKRPILKIAALALPILLQSAGCSTTPADRAAATSTSNAQLFKGMGPHRRPVTTTSSQSQAYFDQGLTWAYAFNHDEAIRSFSRAGELDPNLAMAWWGAALCLGPHINNPVMPPERSRLASTAVQKAQSLKANASPVEQALIDALAARYAWPAPTDRAPLDQAYAAAMADVHRRFPNDLDVTTLYAESLMDLQPWDLWTKGGEPKGRATEIVALLESVLAKNPKHPGAAHLYIHAVEASESPERADNAAQVLRSLVPASGHLSHMPSHIDVRVGRWPEAAEANRRAVAIDAAYRKLSPHQDFYRVYMFHNEQFLSFVAMMMGRSSEAIAAARGALDGVPEQWAKDNAGAIDGYLTIHLDALKRFGKWDELLKLHAPPEYLPYTTAMWRFNRAVAYAALGKVNEAEQERTLFIKASKKVPAGALVQINPAERVLALATHMLDGEIHYAKRDYDSAARELRAAIEIEDSLQYMEPPDWMQPVRHTLGTVLIDAGKPADAERTYREDLARWPGNGWSLLGLSRSLELQGNAEEAKRTRAQFDRAWSTADIKPKASCLCSPSAR
ncbi:MAG TPA: tetratricopeptide repeat protein [Phycisphaerales bacterium]|nr:tetratricopeptide repeat protein [Phycisphaerales bacterium]